MSDYLFVVRAVLLQLLVGLQYLPQVGFVLGRVKIKYIQRKLSNKLFDSDEPTLAEKLPLYSLFDTFSSRLRHPSDL